MKRTFYLITMLFIGFSFTLGQDSTLTVQEVFDIVSNAEGFHKDNGETILDDFPKNIGTPSVLVHGDAEPRQFVLDLISRLPERSMVYDNTDDLGRFDRIFLDKDNSLLLYIHIGLAGNDSILILFKGGTIDAIKDFIDKITFEK